MGKNIIYYGPPGTGKTYMMQQLKSNYTVFNISDEEIVNAYIDTSEEWLLITLILLQGNNLMSSDKIQEKVDTLSIPSTHELNKGVSSILNKHSTIISSMFTPEEPQVFTQKDDKWFVALDNLLSYDYQFYKNYLLEESVKERYKFVTFHQSFVYEDFVEGIRPVIDDEDMAESGEIKYTVQPGVFKQLCNEALADSHNRYAIFIDEINRGNISEIFGELITLIEEDKRLEEVNQLMVNLPYSKEKFGVPENIDIIGTMNSADRSIALIDVALRRRFEFINTTFNLNLLSDKIKSFELEPTNIDGIDLVKLLEVINKRIEVLLDSNFVVGHAYFMNVRSFIDIREVIVSQIIPLLEEYFYDDLQKIQLILNDLDEDGEIKDDAIYRHEELEVAELFDFLGDYEFEDKRSYYTSNSIKKSSIIKVYSN
ncbi:AAA family ATPase [Piscibacillus salipiscarius]|uniref:AAA family ATPase n=1 Tax=Piscibacillus salipiscarius TaxID=299480 RepID=A0ABW5QDZ8_9BACI